MAIYQGTTKVASNIISGDTLPIGSMIPYGSLTIPEGWLRCDGSAVSRTTYSQLFSVIGTSYGVGDGSTTFNLPNKKGKVSVGYDSAQTEFNAVGKTGGAKTHTLTVEQMPSHNHIPQGRNVGGGTESVIPQAGSGDFRETASVGTTYTGGGGAHNNIQPYETDVWIIKALQTPGVVATVVDNLTSTSSVNALSAKQGKVLSDGIEALDTGKANLASPTFTGTVILPSTTSIGNVSSTELGYVDGVTSAIQTQLNGIISLLLENGQNGRSKEIHGADVNTIYKNGFYYGNAVINAPTGYGYLLVISHFTASNYCYQVWFHQGAVQIYAREIVGGTPAAWKQFTLT